MICLYLLFAIWARYKDVKDMKKMNIIPLKDNHPSNNYFYELMIFTGNRNQAETNSKVEIFCFFRKTSHKGPFPGEMSGVIWAVWSFALQSSPVASTRKKKKYVPYGVLYAGPSGS